MHALFKTLVGKRIKIELKSTLIIEGDLTDIDTFFNFKISNVEIDTTPLNVSFLFKRPKNMFIRGSSVKLVWISSADVNISKLEEATRKSFLYKELVSFDKQKEDTSPK